MWMILVYWGIMIASYFAASKLRNRSEFFSFLPKAMMIAIYVLVFTMGFRMGINEQVISSIGVIGLKALVITVASVAGSMICVTIARKIIHMDRFMGDRTGRTMENGRKSSGSDIKTTLIIVALVAAGLVSGKVFVLDMMPEMADTIAGISGNALTVFLCILIAVIGLDLGISGTIAGNIKNAGIKMLVFPLAILAGTFTLGAFSAVIMGFSVKEALAICAGFGWYSYAPAVITAAGEQYAAAGAVSFMHNVIRETAGIILIPVFARKIGYMEAVAVPGIGAMDVCMPLVESSCGRQAAVYSFVTGVLLCVVTSVMVPLLMSI